MFVKKLVSLMKTVTPSEHSKSTSARPAVFPPLGLEKARPAWEQDWHLDLV